MKEETPRVWLLPPLDRWGSVRIGVGVTLALWATAFALAVILGDVPARSIRFAITFSLFLGYTLAFSPIVLARLQGDFDELDRIDRLGVTGQLVATVVGLGIHFMLGALSSERQFGMGAFGWFAFTASTIWWIVFSPVAFVFIRALWRLRRLGMAAKVNLLHARPLARFGRAASSVALFVGAFVATGVFSIGVSQTFIDPSNDETTPQIAVILFACFMISAVYLPLSGARLAIRAAKQAELARVSEQLGHHDEVLVASDGLERADRLMAYRERVESVAEWPFGVGAAPRAFFYVTLPLLSWIAAALVERALASVLD